MLNPGVDECPYYEVHRHTLSDHLTSLKQIIFGSRKMCRYDKSSHEGLLYFHTRLSEEYRGELLMWLGHLTTSHLTLPSAHGVIRKQIRGGYHNLNEKCYFPYFLVSNDSTLNFY